MKQIWAPWRIAYIRQDKDSGCILCTKPGEDKDVESYILYRAEKNFVIMNNYPYNPGHLMVAPFRHIASLEGFTEEERNEHFAVVSRCTQVLREVFRPAGFNIGINIGRVAGAGLEGHLHTHIVPRWLGDHNFMPVTADTRVVNQALAEGYQRLKERF